jgi:hypothetical protein
MTSNEKDLFDIELPVSKVETIHVENGSQKIASLSIVLKDSETVDKLIEHPFPMAKMIITDVIPLEEDPSKARVLFRSLTNDEVIEASRQFILPPGALMDIFGDTLKSTLDELIGNDKAALANAEEENESDVADAERAAENDYNEEVAEIEQQLSNGSIDPLQTLANIFNGASNEVPLPKEDNTVYSVVITLAEAHLGQVLCVNTNAPAFVLTSQKIRAKKPKRRLAVWEDFIAVLEFPYPDTPEYFDSTAALIQAVTGVYPLSIEPYRINSLRAELMNRVIRLSNGSEKALLEGFSLINPINKLTNNNPVENKPTREDAELFFVSEAVEKIYQITSPQTVAALIHEAPNMEEYIEQMDTLDEILRDSGMEDIFNEVIAETGTEEKVAVKLPTHSSSREELISYYSAPISKETLPQGMRFLANKLQMPILFDYNWASGNSELEITPTNAGEIIVSKLITVAIRFSRLKTITHAVKSNLNPVGFLMQGLNMPGENSLWAVNEAIILLRNEEDGELLFNELLRSSLPSEEDEQVSPERALHSAAAMLYHHLGHKVLEEGWDKETLLISLKDKSLISSFINDVYDSTREPMSEEEASQRPCPIQLATMSMLALQPSVSEIIDQLAFTFRLLAKLNVLKYTDHAENSPEWNEYVEKYLRSVLVETGFDPKKG